MPESFFSSNRWAGKILRLPLRLVPQTAVVPILQGRLRGRKWIAGASNHSYWLGTYEWRSRAIFEGLIAEGMTVYDLGAHVGYYTLLSSVLVGPRGRVFAFEPLPRNLEFLRRHMQLNGCANVTVFDAAVSDSSGTATFEEDASISKGRLGGTGGITVRTVALDNLVRAGELPVPDLIKMDIEGAEAQALQGAADLLMRHHPTMYLSTHGSIAHKESCRILQSMGYILFPSDGKPLEKSREMIVKHPGTARKEKR